MRPGKRGLLCGKIQTDFMTTAFITWLGVTAIVAAALIVHYLRAVRRFSRHRCERLVSLGSEREMLYVPGDHLCRRNDDFDDDADYDC